MTGSLWIVYLYDIAEALRLDLLRPLIGVDHPRGLTLRQPSPEYVRFVNAPLVEPLAPFTLGTGESISGHVAYYDYGVISVELELPFDLDWPELVRFSARWINAPELEALVAERVRSLTARAQSALVKPFAETLNEDYYIVRIGAQNAQELITAHGAEIAQIVRGESTPLAPEEVHEILNARLSYYPNDLLVAGWMAAFIADTPEGAATTIQLLEYANTQLLEFRYYDRLLTARLAEAYQTLEGGTGLARRWRMAREAERLNAIRLDVRELSDRADNAIQFLSDMFSARLYRLAAARVGVPDYREQVDEKLRLAGELYQSMNDRFHQSSALTLELMVVIILIIDLIYLFRGKT
jgi:hypothetical protein